MSALVAFVLLAASNLGFEEWGEGRAIGWTRGDGGRLTSECEDVSEGRCAAKLIRDAHARGDAMTVSQQLPAYPVRGRSVTLSGWIRTEEWAAARSGLWVRVEGAGRELAYSSNLMSGRFGATVWQRIEVDVYVDALAERVVIGVQLEGRGTAWFDDLALSVR